MITKQDLAAAEAELLRQLDIKPPKAFHITVEDRLRAAIVEAITDIKLGYAHHAVTKLNEALRL